VNVMSKQHVTMLVRSRRIELMTRASFTCCESSPLASQGEHIEPRKRVTRQARELKNKVKVFNKKLH